MDSKSLKNQLMRIIEAELIPLINSNYVLWDLPYHINMGDTLIWQGELDFLKKIPYDMISFGSAQTVKFQKLTEDTIILLHGGGNFGDIYRSSQIFRNKVIEKYPNNKIIIFPQTIYYSDESFFKHDIDLMKKHKNLYICVRDVYSRNLLNPYFSASKVKLLPDMAFCMNDSWFENRNRNRNRTLYMKRLDSEINKNLQEKELLYDVKSDWPSFEKSDAVTRKLKKYMILQLIVNKLKKYIILDPSYLSKKIDIYSNNVLREHLIHGAFEFLDQFETIYTTRMHGCILGVMLGQNVVLLDNSYGKNLNFYQAWLSTYDKISLVKK